MEHHQHHHHSQPYPNVDPPDRERFPQWSQSETRELLAFRSELDQAFMETKRNKPLWEAVASQMQLKGFHRTPEQCKSKWKNLVTRFKGSESMESPSQFPFHHEMQTIYTARGKGKSTAQSQDSDDDRVSAAGSKKKKKRRRGSGGGGGGEEVEDVLRELMRQQRETEARWMAEAEAREAERRMKEEEWRRAMERLWEERAEMERRWREREEDRRRREEVRAERRHTLLTALLERLTRPPDGGDH